MKKWFNTYRERYKKAEKGQRGAIIIEATLVLPIFIFLIFTILSIVDICYVQAKMAVAVNSASKELSQYAYLYDTLNLQKYLSGQGGKSSEFIAGFEKILNYASDGTAVLSEDVSKMFSTASSAAKNESIAEYLKNDVGATLAEQLMKKNLVAYEKDDPDAFLRRCRVVNGLDGLNYLYTSFLNDVDQNKIDLVVTYKVQVIKLLGIDYKFTFIQRAQSGAWGKGSDSSYGEASSGSNDGTSSGSSVWDSGDLSRGKEIIQNEKKGFQYTSDKNGFHAYNPSNNEYVKICSANTYEDGYSNPATAQTNIRNALSSAYGNMYAGVDKVGSEVTLKDSSGKTVSLPSDKENRNYKLVLVVPEGSDMDTVNAAARAYEEERASLGEKVTVVVKSGYGSPSPATPAETK